MLSVTACKYNVEHAMENKLIVPDIIPIAPKEMLQVTINIKHIEYSIIQNLKR